MTGLAAVLFAHIRSLALSLNLFATLSDSPVKEKFLAFIYISGVNLSHTVIRVSDRHHYPSYHHTLLVLTVLAQIDPIPPPHLAG